MARMEAAFITSMKQKLNSQRSTEIELTQGLEVRDNIVYQDNQSAIRLEKWQEIKQKEELAPQHPVLLCDRPDCLQEAISRLLSNRDDSDDGCADLLKDQNFSLQQGITPDPQKDVGTQGYIGQSRNENNNQQYVLGS
eukprot:7625337-Ditylum_brightwellii.AAC.1